MLGNPGPPKAQRRSRHSLATSSASSLPKLHPSPFEAPLSKRGKEKLVAQSAFEPFPKHVESTWTNEDENSSSVLFESTGKVPRAVRHSVATSVASSVTAGDLGSIGRPSRRSDASMDSLPSSFQRRQSGGYPSVLRAQVRSGSVPLPAMSTSPSHSHSGDLTDRTGSTRSPMDYHSTLSSAVLFDDGSTGMEPQPQSPNQGRASSAPQPIDIIFPSTLSGEGSVSLTASADDSIASKALQNEVAYLTSLLLSETRCSDELREAVAAARTEYSKAIKEKDEALSKQVEQSRTAVLMARQEADAKIADLSNQIQLLRSETALLRTKLTEMSDDYDGCKGALKSSQDGQQLQVEHIQRLTASNSALQNEILGLQERVRNTSAERSDAVRIDVFSSVAQSNLEAEVRKARNEMEFIKKQLEEETIGRLEAESIAEEAQANEKKALAKCEADVTALAAQLTQLNFALQSEIAHRKEDEQRFKLQMAEKETLHKQDIGRLEEIHAKRTEEAVNRAVIAEAAKLEGLVQFALDQAESRHRAALKATAKASMETKSVEIAQAELRIQELNRKHDEAIAQCKQEHAQFMLELSQQHDAEKSAASQRLRAMASKREDLERQLSQQQAVIGELQTEIRCMCDRYTESEERQLMAFEDCASDVPRLIEKRDEIHQSLVVKFRHQWQQEMQQAIDELQRCSDNEKTMMAEEALVRQCVVLQSQQENHQALHQAAVATLHGTHQSHAESLVSKAHEHWTQVVEELKTQHQSTLALAELHKGLALQAAYEDREAERVQLLEHAKKLAEKSVVEALEKAEDDHSKQLDRFQIAADKKLAAKILELMESAKAKTDAAVNQAKLQAQSEFNAAAAEIREEMQHLVATYERGLSEAALSKKRADFVIEKYAGDLAVAKAREERDSRLIKVLKQEAAKLKLRQAVLFGRSISMLTNARTSAASVIEALTARSEIAEAQVKRLSALKSKIQVAMDAGKALVVDENKERISALQDIIQRKHTERLSMLEAKEKLKREMHSIEGGIASTESQIRDFSTVSAVRETGINIEISRKKKRLNADLDSLIDRLQVKKEEFMALDEKLDALDTEIEDLETQVQQMETAFITALVNQQKSIVQVLREDKDSQPTDA